MSDYRTQSRDTSREAERFLLERLRAMSPVEKMKVFQQLSRVAHELALAGIRRRHPTADAHEVRMRLAATRLDAATLREAFGWTDVAAIER